MLISRKRPNMMLSHVIMILFVFSVLTFPGLNPSQIDTLVFGQIENSNPIQFISTSTYIDEIGNFHIIGEVNNTSTKSQTDIVITAFLSDTINNSLVGNYSVFTSISTLRSGELSPFDIVIQNPQQILGKFDFMEFSTTSQPATAEKPATLVLNGSSLFLDNSGNPHITGNIINLGQSPEQSLNLVATFYDNSSLGIVGTQSFGLNVGSLANNQIAPFDIAIIDNKTKTQGAFYSLNVESMQSSMSLPFNTKTSFVSAGGFANSDEDSLIDNSPQNNPPAIVNSNNEDSDTRGDDDNNEEDENDNDNGDNQRGDKRTDDDGNRWFDDNNCSEERGSSGGSSSECEEAEREEENEREDEDSLEKDQGPSSESGSDSTNEDSDERENNNANDDNGEANEDANN
jgi:hypothetical protein